MVHYSLDEHTIKILSLKKAFSPQEAAAIIHGFNPSLLNDFNYTDEMLVKSLSEVINSEALDNQFETAQIETNYFINGAEDYCASIEANEIAEWAIFHEYEWKLKPYKPFKRKNEPLANEPSKREEKEPQSIEVTQETYSPTERETHLQIIASLTFELSRTAQKYKRGDDKINISAISEILKNHADNFENKRTAEAYRKRIVEAVNSFNGAD